MTREANLAATQRWGAEVASAGHYDVLDEILAPGFVDHDAAPDQGPGIEGLKGFFRTMRAAFPDLKAEPVEIVATDDHVAMRYTIGGTHQGEFQGAAPTGKSFEVSALQLARFENGRCVERWGSTDELGMMKQLGILADVAAGAGGEAKEKSVIGALFAD
jgi:predicted ester cyclase